MIPFSRETNRALLFNIIPLVLVLIFNPLCNGTDFLFLWTENALPILMKPMRQLSAILPFSLAELFAVLFLLALVVGIPYRIHRARRYGYSLVMPWEIGLFTGICLWLWAGMTWLWNPLYYVPSLAEKANIDTNPYPVEQLIQVTHYFAQGASHYSTQVQRDETLSFAVPKAEYFAQAQELYQGQAMTEDFPFLVMDNVKVKSIRLSYLQSYFGFTGFYNPYTGEANINTHAPAVLQPATIAHEMAHQRLIAPELEANFLAVVACLDSDNPTYRYSGYLFGLIQLSNALYSADSQAWNSIAETYFTPEMSKDWEDNFQYWQNFQSPVEDVAKDVYDGYLKSNDQELGIQSYGACVDLLVAYYGTQEQETEEPLPSEEEYVPYEEEYIPYEEEYVPYEEDYVPDTETYVPPQETYVPQEQYVPQEEYIPPQEEYVPPQEEYVPPQEEYVPPQEEYVPPQEEYVPPQEEYVPPQEEYIPPQEEYVPPQEEYVAPQG